MFLIAGVAFETRASRIPLFFAGVEVAQQVASLGPVRVVVFMLPFAVAMVLLAARIWQAAARPAGMPQPEPAVVPVSSV